MKKRILSMLMVVCMIVGLLPANIFHFHAHAEEVPTTTKIQFNGTTIEIGATAGYFVTDETGNVGAATVADEAVDSWNIKLQMVDGVAVVTLKGAKLGSYDAETGTITANSGSINGHTSYPAAPVKIVVQESSTLAASVQNIAANSSITSLTIESVDGAVLEMISEGSYNNIAVDEVNFNNAVVTMRKVNSSYRNAPLISTKRLNVTGGNVAVNSSVYSSANYAISASESTVIDGATFTHNSGSGFNGKGLSTPSLTIKNGANVNMISTSGGTVLNVTDAVVEGDSTLYVKSSYNNAVVASGTFTVNSGSVKLRSYKTPMQGALVVNGGSVILQSDTCTPFATVTPVVREGLCYTVKTGGTVDVAATTLQTLEFLSGSNTYQRQAEIIFEHSYTAASEEKVTDATAYNPAYYKAACASCGAVSDTEIIAVGTKAAAGTSPLTLLTQYVVWVKWAFNTGYAQYYAASDDNGTMTLLTGADELDAMLNDTWDIKLEVVDGECVMTLNGVNLGSYDAETDTYTSVSGHQAFAGNSSSYGVAPLRVVVKKDSSIASKSAIFHSGGSFTNLTIESIDNAKLTMHCFGTWNGTVISAVNDITLLNANIDLKDNYIGNSMNGQVFSAKNLYFINSTVNILKNVYGNGAGMNKATESIVIDGGSFTANHTRHAYTLLAPTVTIKNGAQFTVTGVGDGGISATDVNILDVGTKVNINGVIKAISATNVSFGGTAVSAQVCSQSAPAALTSVEEAYLLSSMASWKQAVIEVEGTTYKVTLPGGVVLKTSPEYDLVTYAKTDADGNVTAGTADDWTIKLSMVEGVPTLTLKGATIGNITTTETEAEDGTVTTTDTWSVTSTPIVVAGATELDIVVEADSTITVQATTVSGVEDLTIKSADDATLTLVNKGSFNGLAATTLTIDANLVMNTNGTDNWNTKSITATTLNIVGGNINVLSKTGSSYTLAGVYADTINISGDANVTVQNLKYGYAMQAGTMTVSDNAVVTLKAGTVTLVIDEALTVEGGELNVLCTAGNGGGTESGILTTTTGAITVNGGTLNVDKAKNSSYMHGIWIKGAGSFTVNGGNVVAHTGSANNRYGLYLQAGGVATINGGTVSINGYDHRDQFDEEGNALPNNYSMGNGAVMVGEGSSLTVTGGEATFRSGITPVVGQMTVEGGTVILISHKWTGRQFFDTAPVLPENVCISMSNEDALDGSNPIGSSADMLTIAQAYQYCRIGAHVEGEKESEIIKEPTCIAPGTAAETVRCEHCFKLFSSENEVEVPATGIHTAGAVVIENEVAAGLTTPGSYDEVTYCKDCGVETSRITVATEAIGDVPYILVETVTAAPGAQNVVVKVDLGNNPGIICAQLCIGFDADKLELVSITDAALLNGWITPSTMVNNNPIYVTWDDSLAADNNTSNGTVVTLVFNVKDGATGTAEITVSYDPENLFNFDYENVTFATVNGGVSIEDAHVHEWNEATCTAPKTCATCGETEGEALGHTMSDATCTAPATCSVCGATEGEALGHTMSDATCTAPATCSVCGATEGEALGHSYVDTVVPPTTETQGYTEHVCSVCGHSYKDTYTSAWAADMVLQDGKLVMTADGNIRATVEIIFIGDNVVTDFTISTANITSIKNLGKNYVDVNGANGFRNYSGQTPGAEIVLNYEGNYVIRMKYNDTNSVYHDQMKMISVSDLGITTPVISDTVNDQNELVVTNTNGNTNWAVSVFYIGENTVANAYDSYTDMLGYGRLFPEVNGTKGYRSYMSTNGIQLTEAGNYVIRIMYVDANGTTQFIAKAISVETGIEIPTISGIDSDHNVIFGGIDAEDVASVNVFYLGDETVGQPHSDWADMVRIGKNYPNINTRNGYRWYGSMENIQLNAAGNYVVRLNYYDANGVKRMIAKCVTVETANTVPAVSLGSDGHKLVLDVPEGINMTSVAVFYLADEIVDDPYNMWGQMRTIGRKNPMVNTSAGYRSFSANTNPSYNQLYLNYAGNYVVMVRYTDASGVARILCQYFNIETEASMPTITVEGNNLVVGNREGFTNMTMFVTYLENQTVSDAYAEFTRATTIGKYYPVYNTAQGYNRYTDLDNCKPLSNTGNYYIFLRYTGADGVQQMIAFVYNHTVVE